MGAPVAAVLHAVLDDSAHVQLHGCLMHVEAFRYGAAEQLLRWLRRRQRARQALQQPPLPLRCRWPVELLLSCLFLGFMFLRIVHTP